VRIGIHIAAPGFGIQRGDALDAVARQRLSTVYFPGDKITMLPASIVDRYTLQEGRACPALSLYATVDRATWTVTATETRCESVTVAANLRHNLLDDVITAEALADGSGDYPFKAELAVLWPFAGALYDARQQARIASGLKPEGAQKGDYSFYLDPIPEAEGGKDDDGWRVRIEQRKRGSPLDKIVAELMILANSTWGRMLADAGVPGIYRTQKAWGMHRTRMQTYPAPHEGLGVAQYAWSTSPLRRYVDLVNQWQIAAVAQHGVTAKLIAPFKPKDADLLAAVADFEGTYAAYADHQSTMERYWCLRWLKQEQRTRMQAVVLKEGAVRFAEIPLVTKVPELAQTARGTHVVLDILDTDEISLEVSCRVIEILAPAADAAAEAEAIEEELAEAEAEADAPAEPQPAADGEEARAEAATVADPAVAPPPQEGADGGTPAAA
jgi:exoribonuclease-2